MVTTFRELNVYQRAYKIALAIHKATLDFPKIEQYAIADQTRRASKSICANIAEGFARHHKSSADFKRFLTMAVGSSDEMLVWTDFCHDLGYIDKNTWTEWKKEYSEISRMIHGLSKNWKN